MHKKIALSLLIYTTFIYSGFAANIVVKTGDSLTEIQLLSNQSSITSLDLETNRLSNSKLKYTFTISTSNLYRIILINDEIICSENQKFYDPVLSTWVTAKTLNPQSKFLDFDGKTIPCIEIQKMKQNESIVLYDITLDKPHTFFVSRSQILTHNVVPIVMGISWAIGEGIALTGAGVGIGALGLGLWQKFGNHKKLTFAQIQQECANSTAGGNPDPEDEDKVDNMSQVFKNHPIGKQLQNSSRKTKFNVKGQTVWQATADMTNLGIQKGDLYYLDSLHKDHIEVFCSKGKMPLRTILDLDGTINHDKISKAGIRSLSRYIG